MKVLIILPAMGAAFAAVILADHHAPFGRIVIEMVVAGAAVQVGYFFGFFLRVLHWRNPLW